ncbi:zinc metalloprotease HtpX [Siccirubricoccus phaeus]|uniref:zinc metalloprotease HtpX n=1 Tax=Siccirubricoccus phaeus TaxID=2595053 RepID=UPI0011F0E693|nr:zinc metalloprotease HtpX [Siccirubricoccus phaeus]
MSPTLRHRLNNLAQAALILAGMGLLVWLTVRLVAGPAWAMVVLLVSLATMMAAPAVPRRVLLSAYGARRLDAAAFPGGIAMLAAIARRAALPRTPELWYVPSRLPNAFAMGRPEDSAICVTDGLLRLLDERELVAVLAHEVAHIAHRDLWIMGLADAMSRLVSVASWMGQVILVLNLPMLAAGLAVVPWSVVLLLVFSPTVMALLQLALSRSREFDADLGAARLTGDPEGLVSALLKLERRTGRFWEEIFLPGRRIPEPSLLRTHPPTEIRVSRLRSLLVPPQEQMMAMQGWQPPSQPAYPRFHRSGVYY